MKGVRPEALEKVDNPEIKEIIEGCTTSKTQERYISPLQYVFVSSICTLYSA